MAKNRISKAAQQIVRKNNVNAQQALAEAQALLKQLQAENKFLKQQYKNLSQYSKKQRQKIRSQVGQLKAAEEKIATLKQVVKVQKARRIKAEKAAAKIKAPKVGKPKSYIDNLSKADRRKLYQTTLYVPQFARRLQEHYGEAWQAQWTIDVIRVLNQLDPNTINELITALDLNSVYYESDQTYSDAGITWEAGYVYQTIMSYEG